MVAGADGGGYLFQRERGREDRVDTPYLGEDEGFGRGGWRRWVIALVLLGGDSGGQWGATWGWATT